MPRQEKRILVIIILMSLIVIVADKVSKSFVRNSIAKGEKIIFSDSFTLTHVTNHGFFMNIGDDIPVGYRYWIVSLIPLIAMSWFVYRVWIRFPLDYLTTVGMALLLGGGIGNLSDRIIAGGVTDFMYIELGPFRSSIFNIADLSIFFALIIVLIQLMGMGFNNDSGSSFLLIGRKIKEDGAGSATLQKFNHNGETL